MVQKIDAQPGLVKPVMSHFLGVTWAVLLSLCWLLPVSSPPWSTFAADAWVTLIGLTGALVVIVRFCGPVSWHLSSIWVALLAVLPWVQFWSGLLPFAGQAWITSTYLLGFLLALLVGTQWETANPLHLTNALFTAIGIACFASVGLQLYAWLHLSESGAWGVLFSGLESVRPSANLGQPNQLATLLLWGLIGCLWGFVRRSFGGVAACATAVFLLMGLALTQSRTGLLALTVMLVAIWFWRRIWPQRQIPRVVTGLYVIFLVMPMLLQGLNEFLLLDQVESYFRLETQSGLRLKAWQLFLHAALERPWFGYGWTETTASQIDLSDAFAPIGSIFSHSHNLLLDLVLWLGLPFGLLTIGFVFCWGWLKIKATKMPEDAVLLMLLGAVGIHALLEFPLQYAYFLVPTGLIVGILNVRLGERVLWASPQSTLGVLWTSAVIAFGVTARDYVQVEASYTLLRMEQGLLGQGRPPLGGPPNVWVLTQLREWIKLSRTKPRPNMSESELNELGTIARSFPSMSLAYRLAQALALNGRPDEARAWLGRICKFTEEKDCKLAQRSWEEDAPKDPRTAQIQWPQEP